MGDLNLDPNQPSHRRMIDVIRGQREILLNEVTTKHKRTLDHIFGRVENLHYCQAYLNFISDHFAITIRLSPKGHFINDERLQRNGQPTSFSSVSSAEEPMTPTRKKKTQLTGTSQKRSRL